MMEVLFAAALIAATMTTGIAAGVYQLYAFAIMPGLRRTDDRTFVAAFQQIDKAIVGPFVLVFFLGPLALTALAAALSFGTDQQAGLRWIGGAFALYLAVVILTIAINVPLNNGIKAAGEPGEGSAVADIRERFHEGRWVGWNNFRAAASTIAVGCLAWALVLYGRS